MKESQITILINLRKVVIIMNNNTNRVDQIKTYVGKNFRMFINENRWKSFLFTALITYIIVFVTKENFFNLSRHSVYFDTVYSVFTLVCGCIWIGVFNSINSVAREREIVKREYRSGLNISSYIFAHMIFDFILSAFESIIVVVIFVSSFYSKLPDHGVIFPITIELFITVFLIVYSSDIMSLMISSIVKTPNSALTVMPIVMILQLVFSNRIFILDGTAKQISRFAISKRGFESVASSFDLNSLPLSEGLAEYSRSVNNLLTNWGLLLAFIASYAIIAIIGLSLIGRDKR